MTEILINTIVQHHVCRIFQDTAHMLGVAVITIPDADAARLNRAAAELEEVLTHYIQANSETVES